MRIRTIDRQDKRQVLGFTRHTWEWGDYIEGVFDDWCKEGLFLGAELDGRVVGIMHVAFLSDGSAWFEGGRIHPRYMRRGIMTALNTTAAKMAHADPIRSMVDETNVASTHMLDKFSARQIMGYGVYEGCFTSTGKASKAGKVRYRWERKL